MPNEQKETQATSFISLSRLHTLTDCVFALCLVLLVIFIDRPMEDMNPTEENIRNYLFGQLDTVLAYLITFINISFYWYFSYSQGRYMRRSDGVHVWLTIITLMFIGLLPYSNAMDVTFTGSLTVHIFYSCIVFLVGLFFCVDWLYATRNDRLVDRSIGEATVERLVVESLIQPIAAIASIGGAFIGTFWWELPLMLVPVAVLLVSRFREKGGRKANPDSIP